MSKFNSHRESKTVLHVLVEFFRESTRNAGCRRVIGDVGEAVRTESALQALDRTPIAESATIDVANLQTTSEKS